jgi:hypothetical protein
MLMYFLYQLLCRDRPMRNIFLGFSWRASTSRLVVALLQLATFGLIDLVWPVNPAASRGQTKQSSGLVFRGGNMNE